MDMKKQEYIRYISYNNILNFHFIGLSLKFIVVIYSSWNKIKRIRVKINKLNNKLS